LGLRVRVSSSATFRPCNARCSCASRAWHPVRVRVRVRIRGRGRGRGRSRGRGRGRVWGRG
jgi:hypothetical protein